MKYLASLACIAVLSTAASAEPTSGVDGALFRSSYDTNGIFAVEGARLMPKRDLSFKAFLGYGHAPLRLAVPGIGGDTSADRILKYLVTLDLAFGMTISDRVAIGLDVAGYRTATGPGYGVRGRYVTGGQRDPQHPSTGLIALRGLSNIDPSASPSNDSAYLGDGLAGPLDARFGLKLALIQRPLFAVTAIGSVFLPFGEDEMLLGDRNIVFEPKIAVDWRKDRVHATRVVGNVGVRIRERGVLEGYDPATQTDVDAAPYLDVGSELVVGLGGAYELAPRFVAALEAQAFIPLPDALTWGDCHLYNGGRCATIGSADYFGDAKRGDFTTLITGGATYRVSTDVTATAMVGTSLFGARGEDFRFTTGVIWAPQPGGGIAGRNDRDGDGIPDSLDACPDEAEDKDGFQDEDGCPDEDNDGDGIPDADDRCPDDPEDKDGYQDSDGCPERDNDNDGIPDTLDKCPNDPEDKDGFEDEDGCPDDDNDGDGFADKNDKCPNDPETVNGFEDDDGCPDVRGTSGPEERADRIDLKGAQVAFARGALAPQARQLLNQVATLIKQRRLSVRIEVHVALGTRATGGNAVAAQKRRDKQTAQQRARAIVDYLVSQGVAAAQVQAVGLGADRPLNPANPADPVNERVDFIKAQQGGAP